MATHTLALSCFATHYSSLTSDFSYHPNIRNMHMQTMVDAEKREVHIFSWDSNALADIVALSSFSFTNLLQVWPRDHSALTLQT